MRRGIYFLLPTGHCSDGRSPRQRWPPAVRCRVRPSVEFYDRARTYDWRAAQNCRKTRTAVETRALTGRGLIKTLPGSVPGKSAFRERAYRANGTKQ